MTVFWTSEENTYKKHHQLIKQIITRALKEMNSWSEENNMAINLSKTAYQYFILKQNPDKFALEINDAII